MELRNPQPPQIDGITYDLLGVGMALSTIPKEGRMTLALAVTFTPYRDTPNGPEMLLESQSALAYDDAVAAAAADPRLAQFLGALMAAGQAYVDGGA